MLDSPHGSMDPVHSSDHRDPGRVPASPLHGQVGTHAVQYPRPGLSPLQQQLDVSLYAQSMQVWDRLIRNYPEHMPTSLPIEVEAFPSVRLARAYMTINPDGSHSTLPPETLIFRFNWQEAPPTAGYEATVPPNGHVAGYTFLDSVDVLLHWVTPKGQDAHVAWQLGPVFDTPTAESRYLAIHDSLNKGS